MVPTIKRPKRDLLLLRNGLGLSDGAAAAAAAPRQRTVQPHVFAFGWRRMKTEERVDLYLVIFRGKSLYERHGQKCNSPKKIFSFVTFWPHRRRQAKQCLIVSRTYEGTFSKQEICSSTWSAFYSSSLGRFANNYAKPLLHKKFMNSGHIITHGMQLFLLRVPVFMRYTLRRRGTLKS